MAEVLEVELDRVVIVEELYPRGGLDSAAVTRIIDAIRAGFEMPPIIVDQSYRLIDGRHRWDAHRRLKVPKIKAMVQRVKDDAAFFLAAIQANADHGSALTTFDRSQIALRAADLGLSLAVVAKAMRMPEAKLEDFKRGSFGGEDVALKRTIDHMKDKELTAGQQAANQRLGGMKQTFYVNQVILLLDNGLVNWGDHGMIERLRVLRGLLSDRPELAELQEV